MLPEPDRLRSLRSSAGSMNKTGPGRTLVPQKVLVIDDSDAIHALLRARLSSEPVELHFATDGKAGLEKATLLLPDLILLDVDMPQPDGFEVCRQLKADSRTLP